jgi:hypothetical protein
MASGATVKIGVDVNQFKQGMQQATSSVKTLDAQLKLNEKQFKAIGDAEIYATNKAQLLNKQMQEQKKVVAGIQKELKDMKDRGVDEASESYQKLERAMYSATGKMMDIQTELNSLSGSEQKAASGASELEKNLSSINKKVSLEMVSKGIDSITKGLESAAKKAVQLGENLFNSIMDSAAEADDIATLASKMGLTTTEVQQMQYVANRFEAPAEELAKTWKKVRINIVSDSDDIADAFAELGVATHEVYEGKYGQTIGEARNYLDVFWETGEALMQMTDESKREAMAQKLLGKSWDDLIPLFTAGRQAYEEALESAPAASEDAVNQAAELNDRMKELEQQWKTLKLEAIGALAPALQAAAESLGGFLEKLTAYLQSDAGQEQLQKMGDAISKIFESMGTIDPEAVVSTFAGLIEKITGSFEWIANNWSDVETALKAIGVAFAGIKIAQFALNLGKVVSGFKTLWAGANNPMPTIPGAGGGTPTVPTTSAEAGATAAATGTKAGWMSGMSGIIAPVAGAGISLAMIFGTHALLKADDYEYTDTYEAGRFDSRETRLLEELLNRMAHFGDKEDAQGIADALTLFMAQFSSDDLFRQFRTSTGENLLMTMLGSGGAYAGSLYDLLAKRFGSTDYRDWGLSTDMMEKYGQHNGALWRAANQWADMSANGTLYKFPTMQALQLALQGHFGAYTGEIDATLSDESLQEMQAELNRADMKLPVKIVPNLGGLGSVYGSGALQVPGYANGLFSVPWDGFPAILHKGERVVPERAANYNSNIYFGNVNLNNGLEIEALTESIDRRNRRQRSGYGAA